MDLLKVCEELEQAFTTSQPISQLTLKYPDLTLDKAYAIQNTLLARAGDRGELLAGYKMGLTSKAKQRDVQVFEPIFGFLLRSMELEKQSTVWMKQRIHPRVEPEIAVVLKKELKGPHVQLRDVVDALEGVYPALEIVDSRYQNFKFNLADVVSDNTSACLYMVGRENYINRLAEVGLLGVIVKKNGHIVETGAPQAVLGDPLLSVAAAANLLAKEKKSLLPGQVILTGGITTSVPFQSGDKIEVLWPGDTLRFNVQ